MRLERLSRELCPERLEGLVALDAALRRELGDAYSPEDWGGENFLRELPGKWELSQVALHGDAVCGFWIASERGATVHVHRVGVAAAHRGQGVAGRLFEACRERAVGLGLVRFTVCVAKGNAGAHAFYERLGFRPATERTLAEFLAATPGGPHEFPNELLEKD